MLLVGLGLLVAPLCVLYTDLERTTKLILRALFYASPIIYSVARSARRRSASSPRSTRSSGIFTLYRMGFFPEVSGTRSASSSARVMSFGFLGLGILVFRRLERPVLKEL